MTRRIIVAITGASGAQYGIEGIEQFTELKHVHFTVPGEPG